MDKNEQMWNEFLNKLHFWAGPTVQGWIEGVSLIWQNSQKNLGLRGGAKIGQKKPQEWIIMKKMKKNERNSYLRSFFGLEAQPEGKFRGLVPYKEVLEPLGNRRGQKTLKNCYVKNEQGQQTKVACAHLIQILPKVK